MVDQLIHRTPPSPSHKQRPAPARAADGAGRSLGWIGLVVALLAVPVALLPDGSPLWRAPVALGFACLGPGAALLSHWRPRDPVVTWALVVLVSLTAFAGGATLLGWTGWWSPHAGLLVAAAAVAAACLTALVRSPAGSRFRLRWTADRATAGHLAALAGGAALWLVAVAGTDPAQVGQFGLLATVHPAFLAALLVCAGGFVTGLRRPGPVLGGYLVLLVLILHGTTPLLLEQPQYAWTYKHIGVIELLREQGAITDAGDLYQQWPGLFAAVAWLADLSGVAPLSFADWSPVCFSLAGALLVFAIGRTLARDHRVPYLMGFLFLCLNWVAADYLSPQAFGYLLSLGALLLALRWLRQDPPAAGGWRSRLTAGLPPAPAAHPRTRAAALAGLVLLYAVLTASHQLTPYLLVGQLAVLAVLRLVRPWWMVPVLVAIAVGYLLPRFGLVSSSFDLFESLNIFRNASGNAEGWGSTGQAVSATVVRTLTLAVWGLAALAGWRARHRPGSVLLPAVLAATPFALLAAQSYGGEAIYRVYLFSLPWCAYLIADLLLRQRARRRPDAGTPRPPRTRRALVWVAAVLALAGAALATAQGRHGQLLVDRQTTAEVTAARYLYDHAAPGATIAVADTNFPSRLAGNYDQFNRAMPVGEPDLVEGAELRDARLDRADLPGIEDYLRSFDGTPSYLVISDGMRRQADYFGHLPDGSLDALEAALATSPGWSEFYRNDAVTIYRFDG